MSAFAPSWRRAISNPAPVTLTPTRSWRLWLTGFLRIGSSSRSGNVLSSNSFLPFVPYHGDSLKVLKPVTFLLLLSLTLYRPEAMAGESVTPRMLSECLRNALTMHNDRLIGTSPETGAREVEFIFDAARPPHTLNQIQDYLKIFANHPTLELPEESHSFSRLDPLFDLRTRLIGEIDPADPNFIFIRNAGNPYDFGGHKYDDLTNGSIFNTTDRQGKAHFFVAARGLRAGYKVHVDTRTGAIETLNYVSDVLLFELKDDQKPTYVTTLIRSTGKEIPTRGSGFVFEDPRVYRINEHYVVSGTVISDFLPDINQLAYRNGMAELTIDPDTGVPSVQRNAQGDPNFFYLTPKPTPAKKYDFKNSMVFDNGHGELVGLFRLYDSEAGMYSLLRLTFRDWAHFRSYDFDHLTKDASVLFTDRDLPDPHTRDPRVFKVGFGPGSRPFHVRVDEAGVVSMSETADAPETRLRKLSLREQAGFPIKPGKDGWVMFAHQLRHFREGSLAFRHYDASVILFDGKMEKGQFYSGFFGPKLAYESGHNRLIMDLSDHVYPTGMFIRNGKVYASYGTSDHGTGLIEVDPIKLLNDFKKHSRATRAGRIVNFGGRPYRLDPTVFREYDIRGVAGKELSPEFSQRLGRAFATYLKKEPPLSGAGKHYQVALSWDARASSESYRQALTKGLQDQGVDVIELGLGTTPLTYFAAKLHPNLDGAVMITASHNPGNYNGFKISHGKDALFGPQIQEILRLMQSQPEKLEIRTDRGTVSTSTIIPEYLDYVARDFVREGGQLPFKGVRLVIDSGNGTAGLIAPELFRRLGAHVTSLYEAPDGEFPNHHPDPSVEENLVALKAKVVDTRASLGLAFDGDGDRVGVIDEKGNKIPGDEILTLISRHLLKSHPGAKILAEVKTSKRAFDDISKHGGVPVMYKTGASLQKPYVEANGIIFAAETTGHIIFNDARWLGFDDGIYAGARIIEIKVKNPNTPLSKLGALPHAVSTPEMSIPAMDSVKFKVVDEARKILKAKGYPVNDIDGIRIDFADGWGLLRASNTEPKLTMRFEASTKGRMEKVRRIFIDALNQAHKKTEDH